MKSYEATLALSAARITSYAVAAPDIDKETGLQMAVPVNDIVLQLEGGESRPVPRDWFGKTVPAVGGYLLELEDKSLGYMPGPIFDALFGVKPEAPDVMKQFER